MPAKLTDKQIEALRKIDKKESLKGVHHSTFKSLEDRVLIRWEQHWVYLTDLGFNTLWKIDHPTGDTPPEPTPVENTKKCIGCGQVRPMNPTKGGLVECASCGYLQTPDASLAKHFGVGERPTNVITITLADLEFPADGPRGEKGPDDSGLQGVIVEPDHSDDDTQEIEPIQPDPRKAHPYGTPLEPFLSSDYKASEVAMYDTRPLEPVQTRREGELIRSTVWMPGQVPFTVLDFVPHHTTNSIYIPTPDKAFLDAVAKETTREQYERAYRYEHATVWRHTINTDDIPVDIVIAAYESYKARPDPFPEVVMPFIVRIWYKRLLAAKKALSAIPLDDNAGFNDAVLDFKLLKARYMSVAEHFA